MGRGAYHQQASGQTLLFGQRRRGTRPALAPAPAPRPLTVIDRAVLVADRIVTQTLIDPHELQEWKSFQTALTSYIEASPKTLDYQTLDAALLLSSFQAGKPSRVERRHGALVKAIIDRDLFDLAPPKNHSQAFRQSLALLNNKPMPE